MVLAPVAEADEPQGSGGVGPPGSRRPPRWEQQQEAQGAAQEEGGEGIGAPGGAAGAAGPSVGGRSPSSPPPEAPAAGAAATARAAGAGASTAPHHPMSSHSHLLLPPLPPPRRSSSRGLGEEEDDWIISRQSSVSDDSSSSNDDAEDGSGGGGGGGGGGAGGVRKRGSGQFSAGVLTPGRTQSGTFTPCSPGMGRKRLSFTRMDNLPQVRVDIQHLYYYAGSSERRRCRLWPWGRGGPSSSSTQPSSSSGGGADDDGGSGGALPSPSSPASSSSDGKAAAAPPRACAPKRRAILEDISLSFTPGQLLGVLGPSGSGKTSLLRVLQGSSKYFRNVEGAVLINGTPVCGGGGGGGGNNRGGELQAAFRKMCSLVPQDDILLASLTVHETLVFGAELRLPQQETREQRLETVEAVVQELGLAECRDVVIGSVETAGGISGGQRRRVSIGLELLTDPSVLLLDEPTSGLDSKTAEDICSLLQQLAGPERCVAASIHQPSYQVFMGCFDRIVFLSKGRLAYDGPPSRLATFFASLGFEAPAHENPANFYLRVLQEEADVVIGGWGRRQQQEREAVAVEAGSSGGLALGGGGSSGHFGSSGGLLPRPASGGLRAALASLPLGLSLSSNSLAGSGLGGRVGSNGGGDAGSRPLSRVPSSDSLVLHGGEVLQLDRGATWLKGNAGLAQQHNSLWWQFRVLLRRMLLDACKDRRKLLACFGMEIFTGLVVGLVWFQQEMHKQASIFPIMGVCCMLVTIAVFDSFMQLVLSFPLARALHLKEYRNGYYALPPFFAASLASTFLTSAAYLLSDVTLVFFLVGMEFTWRRFLLYTGLLILGSWIGAAIGFLMGVLTSDIRRVQQVAVPLLMPLLIMSGFMIRPSNIPAYLRWIYHISFYQYIYSSLAIINFAGRTFVDCPDDVGAKGGCVRTGEQALKGMDIDAGDLGRNVAILGATLAVVLAAGYAALRLKSR